MCEVISFMTYAVDLNNLYDTYSRIHMMLSELFFLTPQVVDKTLWLILCMECQIELILYGIWASCYVVEYFAVFLRW